jgi:MinD-like ATPase involved in chromosome partitioning or flagellar assembly
MALIAVASDKGAPGVTTTALALASVWPGPVLLAECDPAGGDLVFRFPGADGRQLDPRRGLLSLAVAGRRDYQQQQVWAHTQKIHGGLDVLLGVTNAEQGAGLSTLWGPLARLLSALPGTDVIADCGRLGPDGPFYDLLAEADAVLLVTRPELGDIIRLRDRAAAVVTDAVRRGRTGFAVDVLTIADAQRLKTAEAEVAHALAQAGLPVRLSCGLADDRKGAELLRGTWGGKLDKSLLIRTAREAVGQLAAVRSAPPATAPQPPPGHAGQAPGQRPPSYGQPSPGYGEPLPNLGQPHAEPATAPPPASPPLPVPARPPGPVPTFRPRHANPGSPAHQSPEHRPPTYAAEGLLPNGLRGV